MTRLRYGLLALVSALAAGCLGEINGPSSGREGPANGSGGSKGTPPGVDIDDLEGIDPETLPDGVPVASRVRRLTYDEYDRTLSDLLYLDVAVADLFPAEPPNLGPYDDLGARSVGDRLLNELVLSAETLADRVITTPASYAELVPCSAAEAGCRDTFIDTFGLRAYRRPLTATERARLQALFDAAGGLTQSGDPFRDGVRLVVASLLQSPKFLYRVEVGTGQSDERGVRLSGYEIASRLSYMLWGTMPDAELFAAAADGRLETGEGIRAQAQRLMESPLAVARVSDFHDRWFQLDELEAVAKDPAAFPLFSEALVAAMRAETRRFVEAVTLENDGGIVELLTAPFGFVNADLAQLYGIAGSFGTDLQRVDFPLDGPRLGIVTQASFLTAHTSASARTSPILRGVFLLERVACRDIPPPPPGAEMMEPEAPPADEIETTREYFEWKTSMPECASCHSQVNPVGFAFEHFDGIGRFRTTENETPVETAGSLKLGNAEITFSDAKDLVQQLAQLHQVRACYAKNWLNYAYGREDAPEDLKTIGLAAQNLASAGFGVRALLVAMTESAAFSHLPPVSE
jgi:hypothetical protein